MGSRQRNPWAPLRPKCTVTKHRPEQPPTEETEHCCPVHGKHGEWRRHTLGHLECQLDANDAGDPCWAETIAPGVVEAIRAEGRAEAHELRNACHVVLGTTDPAEVGPAVARIEADAIARARADERRKVEAEHAAVWGDLENLASEVHGAVEKNIRADERRKTMVKLESELAEQDAFCVELGACSRMGSEDMPCGACMDRARIRGAMGLRALAQEEPKP